ncbi:hypothetical protein LOZ53_006329 [Ophidiomyces ophidiicola]|nr:hypothetical protein LOZ53_006329 [Ophidiomyces ophidiicola]KAI1983961.1 hypothetical protein LOZ54_004724 [Ophidiomyces ophidiicola]KAI1994616.1 hypothetical protein LOZ51_003812 [Ophidiomyces ophidiicola]
MMLIPGLQSANDYQADQAQRGFRAFDIDDTFCMSDIDVFIPMPFYDPLRTALKRIRVSLIVGTRKRGKRSIAVRCEATTLSAEKPCGRTRLFLEFQMTFLALPILLLVNNAIRQLNLPTLMSRIEGLIALLVPVEMYQSDISSKNTTQSDHISLMSDASGDSDCSSPRAVASTPITVVAVIKKTVMSAASKSNRLTGGLKRPRLAIKRARDPPRNEAGQIYCDHPECRNITPTFRRPCEWNKHMDKHDRPYKCCNPDCTKLPGFTYSGGLLRHQREVHDMHTPRKRLMCPHTECNRSSGKGFTRQENLNEHLRRLHSRASQKNTIPPTPSTKRSPSGSEKIPGKVSGSASPIQPAKKRKRTMSDPGNSSGVDSLRGEVVRLRTEIQQKDSRLDELEKVVKELRKTIKCE